MFILFPVFYSLHDIFKLFSITFFPMASYFGIRIGSTTTCVAVNKVGLTSMALQWDTVRTHLFVEEP